MTILKNPLIQIIIGVIFLSSCISQKKINYLQDPIDKVNTYSLPIVPQNIIKPNDELYITVTSIDDPVFNFLGGDGAESRNGMGNELSLSLISYTVSLDGDINFPILGKVNVAGLDLDKARIKLEEQLRDYLNQPSVKIKYAYKKVSLIGELLRPGNYTYAKDQLTILEAISLAGDLTVHGDRKQIYIVRKSGDEVSKILVDLTDDDLIFSQMYYIHPDDVIYVKPRKSLKWSIVATPISLIFSTITTGILILNYVN